MFDNETALVLLKVKKEKPALLTLCGLSPDQSEALFGGSGLWPADAKLLAPEIAVHGSLTELNVQYNNLDDDDEEALQDAVRSKEGFRLLV